MFVRDLTNQEGNQLKRIPRKNIDGVKVRRAFVVLVSKLEEKLKSCIYYILT